MALVLPACEEDDKMDIDTIEVPDGYALSAGTSTVFLRSSIAYDTEADWVTGTYASRFTNGDGLYDDVKTQAEGLGPVYAGYSCGTTPGARAPRCGARVAREATASRRC